MSQTDTEIKHCGIIMPIAAMQGYTAEHWIEVKNILIESTKQIDGIKFKAEIVSNSDGEIDVIHKRIIQNLYNADIVICDISGKNPNVLFELGMRLTFDKPTILIKDDNTDFIFDTGVIEHLTYPKDLRFGNIVSFKKELAKRIKLTYEKAIEDNSFSPFLGNFGEFKVPALKQTNVSDVNQLILDEISAIRNEFTYFKKERSYVTSERNSFSTSKLKKYLKRYLDQTNDFSSPNEILEKEEFYKYFEDNNINISLVPNRVLIKYIEEIQLTNLPF
ncbi:hypothetical protein MH064_02950 [Bacillus altitudinis]|uniref:hypothetical protein n=1 Tax=Bacillus altitudinis TaxID=293387 RepID=UPI00227FAAE8|nr:hypothetical protein [Bacillus altitudinis]MCY7670255.1 hypothetical protein [Bacillus altitudinis]